MSSSTGGRGIPLKLFSLENRYILFFLFLKPCAGAAADAGTANMMAGTPSALIDGGVIPMLADPNSAGLQAWQAAGSTAAAAAGTAMLIAQAAEQSGAFGEVLSVEVTMLDDATSDGGDRVRHGKREPPL